VFLLSWFYKCYHIYVTAYEISCSVFYVFFSNGYVRFIARPLFLKTVSVSILVLIERNFFNSLYKITFFSIL